MSKQPDDTLRDRAIKATIWGRDYETKDGEQDRLFNVAIARSYKDKDGNWKETNRFSPDELLRVSRISEKAYDRTEELRSRWKEMREEEKAAAPEPERDR